MTISFPGFAPLVSGFVGSYGVDYEPKVLNLAV